MNSEQPTGGLGVGLQPVVGPVFTVYLQERWVTCCMCGEETDHTEPADRRCVPIWNGDPTTSNATEVDGYMPACARCYLRWDSWDDLVRSNTKSPADSAG